MQYSEPSGLPLQPPDFKPPISVPKSPKHPSSSQDQGLLPIIGEALKPESLSSEIQYTAKPLNDEEVEKMLSDSLQSSEETYQAMKKLQEGVATNSTIYSVTGLVQMGVADFILKGGSAATQAGLSFFIQSPDLLAELQTNVPIVKTVTDFIDIGLGNIGLIYQYSMVQTAKEEVEKIASTELNPEQRARLEKLKKVLDFEEELVFRRGTHQMLRGAQNAFNSVRVLATYYATTSANAAQAFANAIVLGVGGIAFAIQALIYHRLFVQATENLKIFFSWTSELKDWIAKQTQTHHIGFDGKEKLNNLLKEREQREIERKKILNEKIQTGKISLEEIRNRVRAFKKEGFENLIPLQVKKGNWIELKEKTNADQFPEGFDYLCKRIEDLQNQEVHSEDNKKLLTLLTSDLAQLCVDLWITSQNDDSIKNVYLDHQAILSTTVKSPMMGMISKKHEIEEKFLHLEITSTDTQRKVAAILAVVLLSLAVVSYAVTPIGAASMIVIGALAISGIFSAGFVITGIYFAYQERPQLMTAILKGAYFELLYYYLNAFYTSAKDFVSQTIENRRENLRQIFREYLEIDILEPEVSSDDLQEKDATYDDWMKKVNVLQEKLNDLAWEDFAHKAALKISDESFDTLAALTKAVSESDVFVMNDELKELYEKQMGLDLSVLQVNAEDRPAAVKELIRRFFILRDGDYTKFLQQQRYLYPEPPQSPA